MVDRTILTVMALAVACAAPASARADVVGPAPEDCPVGTQGSSCHGGPYCAPRTCANSSECPDATVCEPRALCVGQVDCSGGWIPPDAEPYYQDAVRGSCTDGATCTSGTCETLQVCVPLGGQGGAAGASPGASQGTTVVEQGCGCRLGGRTPASFPASLAGAALLGGIALARPRRRAAPRP